MAMLKPKKSKTQGRKIEIPSTSEPEPSFEIQKTKQQLNAQSSINSFKNESKAVSLSAKVDRADVFDKSTKAAEALLAVDDPLRTNKKSIFGPIKSNTTVRIQTQFDYAPDICKDYFETGYCTFGDACKFAHIREDYKTGWQIEKEWEAEQKQKQKELKEKLERKLAGEISSDSEESDDDSKQPSLPHACHICRNPFVNPIVTRCGHFFCEKCALEHYAASDVKGDMCAVCGQPTDGIFNSAAKILQPIQKTKRDHSTRSPNSKDKPMQKFVLEPA
ncbi:putative Pre-mRNA-splicing factor cwc24 [Blattamonas nauphoetae]|uniref:Pre-mRNA-splicing factor cwc24 n=1 Tax=Blattamonas nauphoetae TaxID=2049346 RepID=A0ABQ9YFU0_9EUKA|nr:putative Pre-mRNA-splicing factor cwc24 [Blattamonas nauphoetae]